MADSTVKINRIHNSLSLLFYAVTGGEQKVYSKQMYLNMLMKIV